MLIETRYENGDYYPSYQTIKNGSGIIIRTFKLIKIGEVKEGEVNAIYERFNNKGVKTNHITLSVQNNRDVIKNEYLDEKGQVTHTTDLFEDSEINNRQFYDSKLPFVPDAFEYGLFMFYLEHHQPSEESK